MHHTDPAPRPSFEQLALACAVVLAGVTCPDVASAGWRNWTTGDGLADNFVFAVVEAGDGAFWVGTLNGASRFDGLRWTSYGAESGLVGSRVQALLADQVGRLWAGTDEGLHRWDGSRWIPITIPVPLQRVSVLDLEEAGDGTLWLATTTGVIRGNGSAWTLFTVADGLPANVAYCVEIDRSGTVWVGTDAGYAMFNGSTWQHSTEGLGDSQVRAILEDVNGALWFGTLVGGVSRRDGSGWRTFAWPEGPRSATVLSVCADSDGVLWFGTLQGGVSRFDGVSWTAFDESDGLVGTNIMAVHGDADGAIWIGSERGITRFDDTFWRSYRAPAALGADVGVVAYVDRARRVWIGTFGGGVSRYDGRSWTTLRETDGLIDDAVLSVLEDNAGHIWLGHIGGLSHFDGSTWHRIPAGVDLAGGLVQAILQAGDGALWFATDQGVSRFDGSWRTYSVSDGLPDPLVYSLMQDDRGRIWAGTRRGVWILEGTASTVLTAANGLASDTVTAIAQDADGVVWLTGPRGITQSDGPGWRIYRASAGLASDFAQTCALDRDGVLWVGTLAGVSRFDGDRWQNFYPSDGLAGPQVQSVAVDSAGALWFATDQGASVYTPDRVPPRTVVTAQPPLVSPNSAPAAAFVPSFSEDRIQFRVELDGAAQGGWSSTNTWFATVLGDGHHALIVQARDEFGNIEAKPDTLRFAIDATPPSPTIMAPNFGAALHGEVAVLGTAADARALGYSVTIARILGDQLGDPLELVGGVHGSVRSDTLAVFDSRSITDGLYRISLIERDSLGLSGTDVVDVQVDNQFPPSERTSPVTVSSRDGGEVYALDGSARLTFAPRALDRDAVVRLEVDQELAPDSLEGGALRVMPGWKLEWAPALLLKPALIEVEVPAAVPAGRALALFERDPAGTWNRIGGTYDADARRLVTTIEAANDCAVYSEPSGIESSRGLSELRLIPRVLALNRGAGGRIGVAFTLVSTQQVTVQVWNRAGRRVREIIRSQVLGSGRNTVYWSGTDDHGEAVPDGLYIVSVETSTRREKATVAVVR